jgi:hypothetical protein
VNAKKPRVLIHAIALLVFASPAYPQDTYKARLSLVPIESASKSTLTGTGSATAVLTDRRLSLRGTFEGLQSPATFAQIRLGPRGVRGPVMFDLTITKADNGTSGTIAGTFTLSQVQVEAVKAGRFYIQLHSEKAPDGNLWGWLLAQTDVRQ